MQAVMREAYRRLGIVATFEEFPYRRAIRLAEEGSLDGELGRAELSAREAQGLIRVPVPVYYVQYVPHVYQAIDKDISSWKALQESGLKVAVRRGSRYAEMRLGKAISAQPGSYDSLIQILLLDRVDVIVCPPGTIENAIKTAPADVKSELAKIRALPALDRQALYHLVHKRHADLVPKLTQVLKGMEADGTMARLWRESDTEIRTGR